MKKFIKSVAVILSSACVLMCSACSYLSASEESPVSGCYFGTKSPEETKRKGDIVFKDGSATPYSKNLSLSEEQKKSAVAFIFYEGCECSDDGKSRTLGVGLKISNGYWCFENASACYEDIDTVSNNKNGSRNLENISAWLKANGKDDDTDNELRYSAFYSARNYGKRNGTYTEGWYLPSFDELLKVYNSKKELNAVCSLCGLKYSFDVYDFLSSSLDDTFPRFVYSINFSSKDFHFSFQDLSDCDEGFVSPNIDFDGDGIVGGGAVCAVREF